MKSNRRADTVGINANTRREKIRKTIDRLVLKFWGKDVEIVVDSAGRRTYIIDNCVVMQFNTSQDVRDKRKIIDKLKERMNDEREEIRC